MYAHAHYTRQVLICLPLRAPFPPLPAAMHTGNNPQLHDWLAWQFTEAIDKKDLPAGAMGDDAIAAVSAARLSKGPTAHARGNQRVRHLHVRRSSACKKENEPATFRQARCTHPHVP